ncbi:hypothetical protein [Nonomuraea zeae]|uniref:Uncharacterized protein n=1 Tax=Nonomuraea zeae TaxID=1642303 RepID=A0A5S4GJ86_9ACTN|nr:hypothetical protein [Nonomuraea zeae]TMR32983.1 hypothetical protein ETD85_21145 [Nonomuraea zeae]
MRSKRALAGLALLLGSLASATLVPSTASAASVMPQVCNPSCTWTSSVTSQLIATQILLFEYQIRVQQGYTVTHASVDPVAGGYRARLVYH